jgi:virulence-associated protein VapD
MAGVAALPRSGARMYAIMFTLDPGALTGYPNLSIASANRDIGEILVAEGFAWMQGGIWYGDDRINAVSCVLAAQRLARDLPWFVSAASDVRMLRIEECTDLSSLVEAPAARDMK